MSCSWSARVAASISPSALSSSSTMKSSESAMIALPLPSTLLSSCRRLRLSLPRLLRMLAREPLDEIGEYASAADRRQLPGIADQNEAADLLPVDGPKESGGKLEVQHGSLVQDQGPDRRSFSAVPLEVSGCHSASRSMRGRSGRSPSRRAPERPGRRPRGRGRPPCPWARAQGCSRLRLPNAERPGSRASMTVVLPVPAGAGDDGERAPEEGAGRPPPARPLPRRSPLLLLREGAVGLMDPAGPVRGGHGTAQIDVGPQRQFAKGRLQPSFVLEDRL